MKAINRYTAAHFNGAPVAKLGDADKDTVLRGLEAWTIQFDGGVEAKIFFAMLLQK